MSCLLACLLPWGRSKLIFVPSQHLHSVRCISVASQQRTTQAADPQGLSLLLEDVLGAPGAALGSTDPHLPSLLLYRSDAAEPSDLTEMHVVSAWWCALHVEKLPEGGTIFIASSQAQA